MKVQLDDIKLAHECCSGLLLIGKLICQLDSFLLAYERQTGEHLTGT